VKKNVVKEKSFAFAIRIVRLYRYLVEKKEFVLSKQMLRSGTAIGALVRELVSIVKTSKTNRKR
jgi:four helix bundle protein